MDIYLGIAVVLATPMGPVLAEIVTRYIATRGHKRPTAGNLSASDAHAKCPLLPDHVNALNQVEIEFHRVPDVITGSSRANAARDSEPAGREMGSAPPQ